MKTRLVRAIYRRRAFWKRLLPLRRPVRIRLPSFEMLVRLDDWAVGARIAIMRAYEPHVSATLLQLLQPGQTVVDIGANIGYYTLLAATQVGPAGKVIAFEPSVENCTLLDQSRTLNRLANITIMQYAVADRDGPVGYGMDDSNGRIAIDAQPNLRTVTAVTLDRALAHEPRIDIIKIDIEGAEGRAMLGMRALLATHRPIVCTEFAPHALAVTSGVSPEAYLDLLREPGYELSIIPRHGAWQHRPHTNADIMRCFAPPNASDHIDLMAVPVAAHSVQ